MRARSTPPLATVSDRWQPWLLTDAGNALRTVSQDLTGLGEHAVSRIRDAGAQWSGAAYLAAYDRIAGDRDTGTKIGYEIDALADLLVQAGTSLTGYRRVLLDHVDTATAAGALVAEDWTVTAESAADAERYQVAISTALDEMLTAQDGLASEIDAAQTRIAALAPQPSQESSLLAGSPIAKVADSEQDGADPNSAGDQPSGASDEPQGSEESQSSENQESSGDDSEGEAAEQEESGEEADPSTPTSARPATNLDSWTPENAIALLDSIGGITGSVPDVLTAAAGLDDNLADIITAAGGAGAALITATGAAAENFADAVDTLTTPGNQADEGAATPDPSSAAPTDSQDTPPGEQNTADDGSSAAEAPQDTDGQQSEESAETGQQGEADDDAPASETEKVPEEESSGTQPSSATPPSGAPISTATDRRADLPRLLNIGPLDPDPAPGP